jgi:hypothetical protein
VRLLVLAAVAAAVLSVDDAAVLLSSSACSAKMADPRGFDPDCFAAAARCSVLPSSWVCDFLGLETQDTRQRGFGYLRGRQ